MEEQRLRGKKATIYDIANAVGTSAATVSRVLSKSGYPVKEELSRRIFDTAKRMNYTTNMVGRMLKKSESKDIGVIIPTISNPFYPQMVLGIELEARRRGFDILLCNSFRDAVTEKKYIETLYQKQIRGMIISSIDENHLYLKEMQENGIKIVVFDQNVQNLKCSKVGFDYAKGGLMAVEYLVKMGHKNIAFISSPIIRESRQDTLEGYKYALVKHNIKIKNENILVAQTEEESHNGTYEFENGRQLAKKMLELPDRPTAVFAVNDMTAFGIIQELFNNGVKVPEDISVIGFDNIEFSSMVNPPLTTVNQPAFETGRIACKQLLDSMEDDGVTDISITLEPTLIERKSVLKI
jgi:LacI family transcriptional regulator